MENSPCYKQTYLLKGIPTSIQGGPFVSGDRTVGMKDRMTADIVQQHTTSMAMRAPLIKDGAISPHRTAGGYAACVRVWVTVLVLVAKVTDLCYCRS